jgi:hypothetical protein
MATVSSATRPRTARCFVRVKHGQRFRHPSVQDMTHYDFMTWYEEFVAARRPDLPRPQVSVVTTQAQRESLLIQLEEWGIPPAMHAE